MLAEPRLPHNRLLAGLAVMLALVLGLGLYAAGQVLALRHFQRDVLERNRKDTLQLLRMQQDAYALAVSVHDMVGNVPRKPISIWGLEFRRLRLDLNQALQLEAQYAPDARVRREQLQTDLQQFWTVSDQVFALARRGFEAPAAALVERELDPQRLGIHNLIARWLVDNDHEQQRAEQAMETVFHRMLLNFGLATALLLGLGMLVAFWALRANRLAFARISRLADDLDRHAHRLEEMNWRVLNVQEETLQHISRDLHDDFGQLLTALGLMLARAEQTSRSPELPEARALVRGAQQKIRTLSQLLRPTVLDDFGLAKTLEWYAGEFARQAGIRVDFQAEGEAPYLAPQTAIQLYRIVQEALNNAARHGHAQRVEVRLGLLPEQLTIAISDDGTGFDPARLDGHGLGLTSMRERARQLGGRLDITGRGPRGGTEVRVAVPVARGA